MTRVIVVDNDNKISSDLINRLNESSMVEECQIAPGLNGDCHSAPVPNVIRAWRG